MSAPLEVPASDWVAVIEHPGSRIEVPEALLSQAGVAWARVNGADALADALGQGAAAILLPGELESEAESAALTRLLNNQPAWSDIPVIVISDPRIGPVTPIGRLMEKLGNVILLQQPLRGSTFVSVLHSAIRARGRQYHALRQASGGANDRHDFLANLAHELRNPLAPIANGLQMLRAGALPPAERDVVEMLQRQTQHLVQVIDDLLQSTQLDTEGADQPVALVNIHDLIAQTRASVEGAVQARRVELHVTVPEAAAFVRGEQRHLRQAVSGILGRAMDETGPGGQVDLVVVAEKEHIAISICDNGAGLTAARLAELQRLLEQPVTAATADRGLGVALTLASQVVTRHGGRFRLRSDGVGSGTVYEMALPRVTAASVDGPDRAPADSATLPAVARPQGGPPRALIVDDNRDAADTLAMLLTGIGCEVQVTYDGFAALDAIVSFAPEVVLLDIGMPGLSGYELAHRIRAGDPDRAMLLIAQTGWGHQRDRQLSAAAGIDHHLVKPIDFVQLHHILATRFGPSKPFDFRPVVF